MSKRKKLKKAQNKARVKALLQGKGPSDIERAGKNARKTIKEGYRRKAMRSTITSGLKKSIKKSFKSGEAKGSTSRKYSGGVLYTMKASKSSPLAKGAAKAGRVYKMTAAHKKAISRALKGRKR
jgi:hypothetical protein